MPTKRDKKQIRKHRPDDYTATQEITEHSSPLPPAAELERYQALNSTFAVLLTLTEQNSELVRSLSINESKRSFALSLTGLLLGFSLAGYCAYRGLQWATAVIAVAVTGGSIFSLIKRNIFRS